MFDKQQLEDDIYERVVKRWNEYCATERSDSEILQAVREMLQALHFVIEEQVVQVLYASQMRAHLNKGGEK